MQMDFNSLGIPHCLEEALQYFPWVWCKEGMLVAQLEKMIQNLHSSGPHLGLMFATYVECHKTTYQSMLALEKKTNHVIYDSSTCVYHFLNGITNPTLVQAFLSLEANHDHYSSNFDATIEYCMNQVHHLQVNQQHTIASVGRSAVGKLKTHDDCRNDRRMHLVCYLTKEWAQLSSAQKSSI